MRFLTAGVTSSVTRSSMPAGHERGVIVLQEKIRMSQAERLDEREGLEV